MLINIFDRRCGLKCPYLAELLLAIVYLGGFTKEINHGLILLAY